MKSLCSLLLLLSAVSVTAAEPWICTTTGTRRICGESVGGTVEGTTTSGDSAVESRKTQWLVPGIGLVRQAIPVCGNVAGITELKKIIQ